MLRHIRSYRRQAISRLRIYRSNAITREPITVYNPVGVRFPPGVTWALVSSRVWPWSHRSQQAAASAAAEALPGDPSAPAWKLVWRPPLLQQATLLRSLTTYRGVLDQPVLHQTAADQAELLARMAMVGAPVSVSKLSQAVCGLLAPELVAALQRTEPKSLTTPLDREAASVQLRRIALTTHGRLPGHERVTGRSISVLLPVSRPDRLGLAATQVARQRQAQVELVVVLHGEGFSETAEDEIQQVFPGHLVVLRRPSSDTLGAILHQAAQVASGSLIAKMDDDDLYGPHHLQDLELAHAYSNATLAGKGAEFVYLKQLDITIRRFSAGSERWHNLVGGGTLLLSKEDLHEFGGWPNVSRRVDRQLIARIEREGGSVYRTHGFEYVLNRFDTPHTWSAPLGYFLQQATDQWRGLPRKVINLDF